ncbi:MAG: hypothetical protein P4K83_12225 [Terracidiphilus sp.]|nr:hypothetical protein [Terracidiphilus sp.]
MPTTKRKSTPITTTPPEHWFVKELAGEEPPTFSALQDLHALAHVWYQLRPWELLDDSDLILVRDRVSGELCYCSVMGALGEVFQLQVYLGEQSYLNFCKLADGEQIAPAEFMAGLRSVSVEFVPRTELEKQDRDLLNAVGYPKGRGQASPIFRAIRPGYLPWFVNAAEAQTLTECLRAVLAFCRGIEGKERPDFWGEEHTYPLMERAGKAVEHQYTVRLQKAPVPAELPMEAARLDEELLRQIKKLDLPVRGAIEVGHTYGMGAVGGKYERKASTTLALAADAVSGMIYAPELAPPGTPVADSLAKVFMKAVLSGRVMPSEVCVRGEFKTALAPLTRSFGVTVKPVAKLRAVENALASLQEMMGGF